MSLRKLFVLISLFLSFLFVFTFSTNAADIGTDYTVFRTVNTLSCHPQNPNINAIPGFLIFSPTGIPSGTPTTNASSGYCAALNMLDNPVFVGSPIGSPGRDGQGSRPAPATLHYVVIEIPNPNWAAANDTSCRNGTLTGNAKFCGKYIHWEGLARVSTVAISSNHEAWHFNDALGAIQVGQESICEIWRSVLNKPETFTQADGTTSYAAYLNTNMCEIKIAKPLITASQRPLRPNQSADPSDNALPSFSYTIKSTNTLDNYTVFNPTRFTDIAHDRFGNLTNRNDTSWVKCRESYPSGYFGPNFTPATNFDPATIPILPVAPNGCDYPSLTTAVRSGSNATCLSASYTAGVPIPTSLENCSGTNNPPPTNTPTPTPTATPTPDFQVSVAPKNNTHPQFGVGSTNGFVINGVQGEELTLTRGVTYRFNIGSTQSSHPFYLTTSVIGNGQGTTILAPTAVTNGVMAFTPISSTPNTIYYACNLHTNMGWRINIIDPGSTPTPTPSATPSPTVSPTQTPGDTNNDRRVDVVDYVMVVQHLGQAGSLSNGDVTGDGKVNLFDYSLVISNFYP